MNFNHVNCEIPSLDRETIDGVRYYKVPDPDSSEVFKLVSITSVISHHNKDFFAKWRKRVGEAKADSITRKATSRGTDFHTLTENHLNNIDFKTGLVQPLSEFLFLIAKDEINKIDNIHALEQSLYSKQLGVAGTVDCIAEYNGELAIIDDSYMIEMKKGDVIMFPSNFQYPHSIKPIVSGRRYSMITWAS